MLKQLLKLLNSDPLSSHDKLMLKAALTFGFFGFLRVSEYTRTRKSAVLGPYTPDVSIATGVKKWCELTKGVCTFVPSYLPLVGQLLQLAVLQLWSKMVHMYLGKWHPIQEVGHISMELL